MTLLKWAAVFFIISVIAGLLGFTGLAAGSAAIAQALFYIFLGIFLILLVAGLVVAKKIVD
ncbi:UPF0391 membrane protein [Nitrospira sp.]|nr:UPF0391 membrane protein [Nitrospira sp.]